MDLATYFKNAQGTGILATCDPQKEVDLAIYSKPVVADGQTVALVMKQRQSHRNLQKHLKACYMFIETGTNQGVRLYLTMERQETNRSLIEQLRREQPCMFPKEDDSDKFLVFFKVDHIRPLVGEFES
jgi:ADP-glucose pyrophosphorylase